MNVPKGWKKIKFGQLAREKSNRVDNPSESGFEKYVGLEHLDSGNLIVKRWGNTNDVTSAMKLFNKNDILFARRNTYLRRVSVAPFDGVCSGDIIVIEPILNEIIEGFLPIYMQLETFENRVISLSAGAFSKRIKWKQLAEEEILIPTKAEQQKIVNLIWGVQDSIEKIENLILINEKLKRGLLNELLTKGIRHTKFRKTDIGDVPENWKVDYFNKLVDVNPKRLLKKGETTDFIEMADVQEHNKKIQNTCLKLFKGGGSKFSNGDTLLARITPCLENGKTAYVDVLKNTVGFGSTEFIVLSGKEFITDNEYVYLLSISPFLRMLAINAMIGTTGRQRVPNNFFNSVKIAVPSIEEQKLIVKVFIKMDSYITKLNSHKTVLLTIKKNLTTEMLSGDLRLD